MGAKLQNWPGRESSAALEEWQMDGGKEAGMLVEFDLQRYSASEAAAVSSPPPLTAYLSIRANLAAQAAQAWHAARVGSTFVTPLSFVLFTIHPSTSLKTRHRIEEGLVFLPKTGSLFRKS